MALECARIESARGWLEKEENDLVKQNKKTRITDDTPIFRYVSSDVFLLMVEHSTNALSHISRWEDPCEGLLFRGKCKTEEDIGQTNGLLTRRDMYCNCFGQSWTLCERESDLRWRAYCINGDGVRIKSSVGRLKKSLLRVLEDDMDVACYLSRVYYQAKGNLERKVKQVFGSKAPSPGVQMGAEMLFVKSDLFEDEQEYRVVIDNSVVKAIRGENGARVEEGFWKYPIYVNSDYGMPLIDEVLLDPRMGAMCVERIRSRIAQAGARMKVVRSMAYSWGV